MKTKLFLITLIFISVKVYSQERKRVLLASTNFNIPLVQFTPIKDDKTKKGDVSFFNSVGAGVGVSLADLTFSKNASGDTINAETKNKIGIQTGFLFAANGSDANKTNKLAWTMSLAILDFQIGYGYEFGTLGTSQKRSFFMLSYNIPLSKLSEGGSYIFRHKLAKRGLDENPKGYFLKNLR